MRGHIKKTTPLFFCAVAVALGVKLAVDALPDAAVRYSVRRQR